MAWGSSAAFGTAQLNCCAAGMGLLMYEQRPTCASVHEYRLAYTWRGQLLTFGFSCCTEQERMQGMFNQQPNMCNADHYYLLYIPLCCAAAELVLVHWHW